MKSVFIFVLFGLAISVSSMAQGRISNTMDVTGRSSVKVKPDETTINMAVSSLELKYDDAIKALNRKTRDLTRQLKKVNFNSEDIKTSNFTVNKNTVYRHGQRIDSGYRASQYLDVVFPYDKERIGDIIEKIGSSEAGANIQFSFGLSDAQRRVLREKLIVMAVEDAKEKARIIAAASGIELQGISNIHYTETGVSPPHNAFSIRGARAEAAPQAQVEAREIEIHESIEISWNIGKE
jgi:uncharacterized protein YggE